MMNTLKNKLSVIWLLASLLAVPVLLASCDDDDDDNVGADPVIRYFRTTYAAQSDSMIVAGSLGQVIAIIGENLQNVTAIRFNDCEATLNPCYITDKSIVVTIPTRIPTEITNKVYLTARNGNEVQADFEASIPSPLISSVSSLVFREGQNLTLKGNYFVGTEADPITVNFPGGATIEVTSTDYKTIKCQVPFGGANPGLLSVTTAYGTSYYSIKVNDISGSNVYANMDGKDLEIWCSDKATVTNSNAPVSGNYLNYKGPGTSAWNWGNPFGTPGSMAPLDYTVTQNTCLAFEMRTNTPWTTSAPMSFQFGSGISGSWETNMLMWAPWADTGEFSTDGEWQTVFVSVSGTLMDKTGADLNKTVSADDVLRGFCVMFWGQFAGSEGSCDVDIDFDNFRLLEK